MLQIEVREKELLFMAQIIVYYTNFNNSPSKRWDSWLQIFPFQWQWGKDEITVKFSPYYEGSIQCLANFV